MLDKAQPTLRSKEPNWSQQFLQSLEAWIPILLLVMFSVLGTLIHLGSIMRFGYIAGCFAVGVFLFLKYPAMYMGFGWWVYFITPFLARIIDLQSGWDPLRTMLVAPELVWSLTGITFLRYAPRYYRQGGAPFALAVVAIVYGLLIGVAYDQPPFLLAKIFLTWINGIFIGFHLFVNWRNYPEYRQSIQRAFVWGVLVMGIYGIFQYLTAPEWDRLWLIESEMYTSAGNPAPLEMRVWSTLQSPGVFATGMTGFLLVLLSCRGPVLIPSAVVGFLSFLLSLVRSSWGGWFVGMLTYFPSLKPRLQMRLLLGIAVMVVCIFPLATIEPFSERIGNRLATLSDIQNDGSFRDRKGVTGLLIGEALAEFVGRGLASGGVDNGLIAMLFLFGWIGTILYFAGVIHLVIKMFQTTEIRSDSFWNASRAVVISQVVQIPFGAPFGGLAGILVWAFGGLTLAGRIYHENQQITNSKES